MAGPIFNTLLFDLGNVLFPFDWGRAVRGFSTALGRPEKTLRKRFGRPEYAKLFYEFGTGQISKERFFPEDEYAARCGT
ncbi:MAG: hypothetical protein V1913_16525 [Fibrobacterota bacterium]